MCVGGILIFTNKAWCDYLRDYYPQMLVFDTDCSKSYKHFRYKLATLVESPFSMATKPRCREGRYSFPWIAPLYPWSVPYNAEC